MSKIFVGIDPGKDGAIVVLSESGTVLRKHTIPKIGKEVDEAELANIFRGWIGGGVTVVLEDVHALFGSGAGATFAFGDICGFIRGLLVGYRVPFVKVQPKKWQSVMFEGVPEIIKPMKEGQKRKIRDTKAMALIAAKRLFPDVDLRMSERAKNPHDGIVDALLMAEYARRKL